MNYTNPGAISHNEILELYKQYVDPDFAWSNFSIEEQAKVIKAARSNNLLDTKRVRCLRLSMYWLIMSCETTWHQSQAIDNAVTWTFLPLGMNWMVA